MRVLWIKEKTINKILELTHRDQSDRCRGIEAFFIYRDGVKEDGKALGPQNRFWNRQFSS